MIPILVLKNWCFSLKMNLKAKGSYGVHQMKVVMVKSQVGALFGLKVGIVSVITSTILFFYRLF